MANFKFDCFFSETCLKADMAKVKSSEKPKQSMANTVMVSVEDLNPSEYNPRRISDEEIQKIKKSITKFGFCNPIVANENPDRLNIIIGGHQRFRAAKEMGWKAIPVVYVNLGIEDEKTLNIALNKIGGEFDEQALKKMMDSMEKEALSMTGFDEKEIDKLMGQFEAADIKDAEPQIDKADELAKKYGVKTGQIWQLGNHRIACGDCTDQTLVSKLMGYKCPHCEEVHYD